jgi:RNA polymerase sigma-70 factor (ECF subfamily)
MKQRSPSSEKSNVSELSEADAIRLAQAGDAAAFERLYRLHSRRVYALCLRMVHNSAEAEDLTQDTFLHLFRKLHQFRGESRFSTWLHRMTVNIVLMRFRKKKHPEISLDETANAGEESSKPPMEVWGPDLRLSGAIDRITLEKAADQLPVGYKKMFILHDVRGYEHNEIARILGCSVGNSKSQLHKARMRLRELLPQALGNRAGTTKLSWPSLRTSTP